MLRATLLGLMITLSKQVEQEVVETISMRLAVHVNHCQKQLQMEEEDVLRYVSFWTDDFDFDVWYDGCLVQCVLQRLGLTDEHGNLIQSHAIAFGRSSGADDDQIQELYAMVTTQCVASEVMSNLPKVDQPPDCVRPMLIAICFRRGILEAMQPESRRNYDHNPNQLEILYSKLFELFTL